MLKLLEEKGVVCDFNWLMFGIGNGPRIQQVFIVEEKEAHYELLPESMEEKQIISELEHFRSLHENSIDLVITDDTMRPFYEEGELVAGINRFKNRLKSAIGLNCIVQTKDGKVLLRRVQEGTETGRFILTSLNTQTQSPDAILYNVELISAAPVIWRRRKNPKIA